MPLGSGSVDPHIFADPDPGSQNLADPTDPDPDPKHCMLKSCILKSINGAAGHIFLKLWVMVLWQWQKKPGLINC